MWDSQEDFDAFGGVSMPILAEVGVDPGQPDVMPLHDVVEIVGRRASSCARRRREERGSERSTEDRWATRRSPLQLRSSARVIDPRRDRWRSAVDDMPPRHKEPAVQHLATATALKEIFSTIIDGGSYEQIDRHFTPDYIDHSAVGDQHGTEAFIALLEGFRLAIPGFRHDVSDVTLVGEDMALWQTHVTATFSGEFMGVRGHGQQIDLWVPNAAKFADDGRMSEHWGLAQDALGRLMSQMGVDAATAPTG